MSSIDETEEGRALKKLFLDNAKTLTNQEISQVVYSAIAGHGEGGISEGDLDIVTDWADGAVVDRTLLDLVLRGEILIRVHGKSVGFKKVANPPLLCPNIEDIENGFDPPREGFDPPNLDIGGES